MTGFEPADAIRLHAEVTRLLAAAGPDHDAVAAALPAVRAGLGWGAAIFWDVVGDAWRFRAASAADDDRWPPLVARHRDADPGRLVRDTTGTGQLQWEPAHEVHAARGEPSGAEAGAAGAPAPSGQRSAGDALLLTVVAVPARRGERVVGVLELLDGPGRQLQPGVRDTLEVIAAQLAQALALGSEAPIMAERTARLQAVVDAALDAVVVIDDAGRIVEFNGTAEKIFGYERAEALGARMAELLIPPTLRPFHDESFARHLATGQRKLLGQRARLAGMRKDGSQFPVEVGVERLDLPGAPLFVGFVRDNTSEHQIERTLIEAGERFAEQARTLQLSLLPREVPVIEGIDLAVCYSPAGEDMELGGDLYDVFQAGPGVFGLVVGDVEGKGIEAAAVTALTRFTIRAVATRAPRPRAVLSTLNEAILAQGPGRLCTVVYARLSSARGRHRLTVGLSGHPPPLLLRGGIVSALGRPGTILGVVDEPDITESSVDLQLGDVVLFFTDGLTEARSPRGELLGDDRLCEVLRQCDGLDAPAVAERLERVAIDFQGGDLRDDVALIVLRVAGPA